MNNNLPSLEAPGFLRSPVAKVRETSSMRESPKAIERVAKEFEGLFLNELFKVMRRTVPDNPDNGLATSFFTQMLDAELAKVTAGSGGLGIAETLRGQLLDSIGVDRGVNGLLMDGNWVRPVQGAIEGFSDGQRFGAGRSGLRPEECGEGHCGLDFGRKTGTAVRAASEGVVARINRNENSNAGLWVELSHRDGRIATRYMHLDSIREGLIVGDKLNTGDFLGEVGNTGAGSRGAHLHFEVLENNGAEGRKYLNPQSFLRLWGDVEKKRAQRNHDVEKIFPKVSKNIGDSMEMDRAIRWEQAKGSFKLAYLNRYKLKNIIGGE